MNWSLAGCEASKTLNGRFFNDRHGIRGLTLTAATKRDAKAESNAGRSCDADVGVEAHTELEL